MAIAINKARITLTDSGIPRSRFRKYVEYLCVVHLLYVRIYLMMKQIIIIILLKNNNMSDKEIIDTISYYLDNEDKRLKGLKVFNLPKNIHLKIWRKILK